MRVRKLLHTRMRVSDMDQTIKFYTDVLALEAADRSPTAALLSSPAGAGLILSALSPHGSFYIITSLLTIAWLAGTGAVLWTETTPGHARRGHVGEIRDESVMVMSRGAGAR